MSRPSRSVGLWLLSSSILVLAMILLGGLTRLTRSGLSITTWDPILGALPPLGDAAWSEAFERYVASPEGRLRATDMDLEAFRHIYLMEWAHRLLGRVIAVWLLVPMTFFAIRRRIPRATLLRVVGVLLLGGAQGVLGWYMVKSGLVDVPHVSPYRLMAHFLVGVLLFAVLLSSTLDALASEPPDAPLSSSVTLAKRAFVVVVTLTLAWGALMAGHHAGLVFSDFPTMGGDLVPVQFRSRPFLFRDLVADLVGVHFMHRVLALLLLFCAAALLAVVLRSSASRRARAFAALLVFVVLLQGTLGALTVMRHVPIALASLHQGTAVLVVAVLVLLLRELRSPRNMVQSTIPP
jgi:cytochrome c oxidase assembly protein subunit 15